MPFTFTIWSVRWLKHARPLRNTKWSPVSNVANVSPVLPRDLYAAPAYMIVPSFTSGDGTTVRLSTYPASFLRRQQDGFVENPGGEHNFGEEEQTAGRVALRWEDGGPFTADFFYEHGNMGSTPNYYVNDALAFIPGYSSDGEPEDEAYRVAVYPVRVEDGRVLVQA